VSEYGEPPGGSSPVEVGKELDVRVIRLDPEARRIGLSLKFDPEIVKREENIQESRAKTRVAIVEPSSLPVVQAKN
jgi:ribosomal protein S1